MPSPGNKESSSPVVRDQPAETVCWGAFCLQGRPEAVVFLVAYILAFLLSKVMGFAPGFSLDDYVTGQSAGAPGLSQQLISQGRFTFALLHEVFERAHLHQADFAPIGLLALALFSGLFYSRTFSPNGRVRFGLWIALGMLLGAHSYFAEYVTFRQAIIPMALTMALSWLALDGYLAWLQHRRHAKLVVALLAGVLATGINQLAVSFISISILFVEALGAVDHTAPKQMASRLAAGVVRTATSSLVLVLTYILVLWSVQSVSGIHDSNDRVTFLALSAIPHRMTEVCRLLILIAVGDEMIASQVAKSGLWLAFSAMLLAAAVRRPFQALVAMVFLIVALTLAILPVAVGSVWWPVPRTLIAVPMAFGGAIVLLSLKVNIYIQRLSAVALGVSAILLAGHSASALNDQQRLNRWDIMKARDIASYVTQKYPASRKLALSGASWAYPIAPNMAQGDMNVSAISIGWAVDALFDEAVGADMSVRVMDPQVSRCASRPRFPSTGSTYVAGDEVVACL